MCQLWNAVCGVRCGVIIGAAPELDCRIRRAREQQPLRLSSGGGGAPCHVLEASHHSRVGAPVCDLGMHRGGGVAVEGTVGKEGMAASVCEARGRKAAGIYGAGAIGCGCDRVRVGSGLGGRLHLAQCARLVEPSHVDEARDVPRLGVAGGRTVRVGVWIERVEERVSAGSYSQTFL